MRKKRLGEVLRERGQISARDLNQAIQDQQEKLVHLGELMLERRLVAKEDLVAALSEVSHIPYVDCATVSPDAATIKLVPADVARRKTAGFS